MTGADLPPPSVRPDIRAVALAAGVSVSTVSRALNGYADVNADTRKRVERAAETLGYRPSHAAAMLRRSQTGTVTFMVSKPWTKYVDPYFLGLLDGLEMMLAAAGLDLQVVMAREFDREIDVIRNAVERNRCDALVFARTRPEDERIDWLEERGFPFVTVGRNNRNSHNFVDRDQVQVGRESARRLVALGHQKIGQLTTPLRYTYTHLTMQGVKEGLDEAGLPSDPASIVECPLSQKTGEEAVTELFLRGARPTALICGNDLIAVSAMDGLRRLGLTPGKDVAVIGCDDIPIAAHIRPSLTTFTVDLGAMGIRIGRMVQARLDGHLAPQQDLIEAPIVLRQSDCPRGPVPESVR